MSVVYYFHMVAYIKKALSVTILDTVLSPLWWYAGGLVRAYNTVIAMVVSVWRSMGVWMWTRHIFTPMFQQYDWQGRIISFFMRLFQVIVRSVGAIIGTTLILLGFVAYLVVPILLLLYFVITFGAYVTA